MLNEKLVYEEQLPVNLKVVNIKDWNTHYHDDIEIVHVLKGTIRLKNVHYTYILNEEDVFVVNARETHSFSADSNNMVLIVCLDLDYFEKYFEEVHNSFFVTDLSNKDRSMEVLRNNMAALLSEYMIQDVDFEKRMIEYANSLISCLITDFRYFTLEEGGKFVNEPKNRGNAVLAERLCHVTNYIYENHASKITLSEVAENVHLSDYYLSHLIKSFTGLSFQEYLNFARVEESEKLLLETAKSISVIAEECGFSAHRYYTKFFQQWFGMMPSEYRKQYREKVKNSEGIPPYAECSKKYVMDCLRTRYSGILQEIRRLKKVQKKPIEIDANVLRNGMAQYIKDSLTFYCNVSDWNDSFEEITALCEELKMGQIIIRVNQEDFYFRDVRKLLSTGSSVCLELCKDGGNQEEIVKRLKKRYGEDIIFRFIEEEPVSPEKNYIYDSIVMVPRILRDATSLNLSEPYSLIDQSCSTAFINGDCGMLTSLGMKKPAYYAYKMVSDLIKGEIIDIGDGYAVSRQGETIRVLIYAEAQELGEYQNPDKLRQIINSQTNEEERTIKLHNMIGRFRVQYYCYERQNSLFNIYGNLGYQNLLTEDEEEFIKWVTVPSTGFFRTEVLGLLVLNVKLSPNAAYLYTINPDG